MNTFFNQKLLTFSPKTEFFDFFGGRFIKVSPIIHDDKLFFGCYNQPLASGNLYYDVLRKSIQIANKDYDITDENRLVIVALPHEIGLVLYDGGPHDRAYNYKRGYYLELLHPNTLMEIKDGNKFHIYLSVESVLDGTDGPYPIGLEYFRNTVVLHLKKY